jgi:hypothetical protein
MKSILVFAALLFLLAASLKPINPSLAADSPWTISDVFSFMRHSGEFSSLAYDYMEVGHSTNILSYYLTPFFTVLGISTYSLIGICLLLNFFVVGLLYLGFQKHLGKALTACLIFAFISSGYFSHFRYEGYVLPILIGQAIFMMRWMTQRKIFDAILVSLLSSIAFLIHPMGAIVSFLLLVFPLVYEILNWKKYFVFVPFNLIFLMLFSEGNILKFVSYWANSPEESHTFDWALIFKFLIFSPVYIYLLYLVYFKRGSVLAKVLVSIGLGVIILFGRSYYFQYLLPLLALVFALDNLKNNELRDNTEPSTILAPKIFYLTLVLAVGLNILIPYGQIIENPNYAKTQRHILRSLNEYGDRVTQAGNMIYVPAPLGMEVAEHANGRIYYPFYPRMAGHKITLAKGDVFVFREHEKMVYMIEKVTNHSITDFEITELVQPVEGLLTPGSLFRKRGPEIGLWALTFK